MRTGEWRSARERDLAASDTPLMQQYREVKQQHPHALVLFRIGDFFELFQQDAEVGARVLGLTVTSRDLGYQTDTATGLARTGLADHPCRACGKPLAAVLTDTGRHLLCQSQPTVGRA